MEERITFIVINWNLPRETADCARSLLAAGVDPCRLIVVENGSTDDSAARLKEWLDPAVHLLVEEHNGGFAAGCNAGLRYVKSLEDQGIREPSDWFFLMNNDTLVEADFLAQAQAAVRQSGGRYDLLGPLIVYYAHPETIWYAGDRLFGGTMIGENPFRDKRVGETPLPALFPVDFLNGTGMLVRRAVFERIGLFDTRFFMYFEEVDFCWRARQAGFAMACAPGMKMLHKVSAVAGKQKPRFRQMQFRNQVWVYRRYARGTQRAVMWIFSLWKTARTALVELLKGQPEMASATVRGWWSGWKENPWQGESDWAWNK